MKNKVRQFKRFINERLLTRWGLRSKVQQISNTISELYEFNFPVKKTKHNDLNLIRQIIIHNPYTVSTRSVHVEKRELEDGTFNVAVSFTVLNKIHGKQIEKTIRDRNNPENGVK